MSSTTAARPDSSSRRRLAQATAVGILAALLIGVCGHLALLSQVSFTRAQQLAHDRLRLDLARGTAPLGQFATASDDGPAELVASARPIALLSIPAIGLQDMVVGEGTTAADLQSGPGHDRMSRFPGQAGVSVIHGRRWTFGAPFADVPSLVPGDEVSLTTGQGTFRYVIAGQRGPGDEIAPLKAGEGRLVMVTAAGSPFMPDHAVYVDATLVSTPVPGNRLVALPPELTPAPMAGDPSAWLPLLLWSEGLLLAAAAGAWGWSRWGRARTWLAGTPVVLAAGIGFADALSRLLPNIM